MSRKRYGRKCSCSNLTYCVRYLSETTEKNMTKSLKTTKMSRTLNYWSPEHEAEVQTATYVISVVHSGIPADCSTNCTELLLSQERTEFPHLLNRVITLVALWKGKRLNCLILRAVVAGALEELNKLGTYYTASSPIERRILLFLQETFLLQRISLPVARGRKERCNPHHHEMSLHDPSVPTVLTFTDILECTYLLTVRALTHLPECRSWQWDQMRRQRVGEGFRRRPSRRQCPCIPGRGAFPFLAPLLRPSARPVSVTRAQTVNRPSPWFSWTLRTDEWFVILI